MMKMADFREAPFIEIEPWQGGGPSKEPEPVAYPPMSETPVDRAFGPDYRASLNSSTVSSASSVMIFMRVPKRRSCPP